MTDTVIIIDDHLGVRRSLRALLEAAGFLVEDHPSAHDFLKCPLPPADACIVLDYRMPGMNGLDLQDELARRGTRTPVILLTAHGDVPLAVKAMRAGAIDVLEKPVEDQVLIDRIRAALSATAHSPTSVEAQGSEGVERLTARERDVLGQLGQGSSNKQIAAALKISPRTVEIHRAHIQKKLNAHCLADLIRFARQRGLA